MSLGSFFVNINMNKHETPESYRIVYRVGRWMTKSKRYYIAYHSSEALQDIYHTFTSGRIRGKRITIHKIEEFNRFANEWEDRIEKALEHASDLEGVNIVDGKIVLRRLNNST